MMTPYSDIRKKLIGATICCFIVGGGQGLVAQKVIFPQQQQASTASLVVGDGTTYLKIICSPPASSKMETNSFLAVAKK